MRFSPRLALAALAPLVFSCAPARPAQSNLTLEAGAERIPLTALNANAAASRITAPAKSAALYYGFPEAGGALPFAAAGAALEIRAEFSSADAAAGGDIMLGFLYRGDFDSRGRLLRTLSADRALVWVRPDFAPEGRFAVSLAFSPGGAGEAGFFVRAPFPLTLTGAAAVPAETGFSSRAGAPRACFAARGGAASKAALQNPPPRGVLAPLRAAPGALLAAERQPWRVPGYELYRWEQFPAVLIFDTGNYAVQDEFFKRLAFFSEKKGFRGALAPDSALEGRHGFNANDFRAETLAAFFSLAEQTAFPLNPREALLRDTLEANGVILRAGGGGYEAGNGAVISISRESPDYLRRQLLVHEALHGLYFTEARFRDEVARVYAETDPQSIRFLEAYFDVTPALAYDVTDSFLMQNEFMAYLLQQPASRAAWYFGEHLASLHYVNAAYPALARYVRETRGRGFTEAAEKLSAFLAAEWGLEAGRVWRLP